MTESETPTPETLETTETIEGAIADRPANLAKVKSPSGLVEFDELFYSLEELAKNCAGESDMTTKEGIEENRIKIANCREAKGLIEKTRKEAKAAALAHGRKVERIANEFKAKVEDIVAQPKAAKKVIDDAIAAKKQVEADRVAAIEAKISEIRGQCDDLINKPSETIQERINAVVDFAQFDFQELDEDAATAISETIDKLRTAKAERIAIEEQAAENARVAKEQADAEVTRQQTESLISKVKTIRDQAEGLLNATSETIQERIDAVAELAKEDLGGFNSEKDLAVNETTAALHKALKTTVANEEAALEAERESKLAERLTKIGDFRDDLVGKSSGVIRDRLKQLSTFDTSDVTWNDQSREVVSEALTLVSNNLREMLAAQELQEKNKAESDRITAEQAETQRKLDEQKEQLAANRKQAIDTRVTKIESYAEKVAEGSCNTVAIRELIDELKLINNVDVTYDEASEKLLKTLVKNTLRNMQTAFESAYKKEEAKKVEDAKVAQERRDADLGCGLLKTVVEKAGTGTWYWGLYEKMDNLDVGEVNVLKKEKGYLTEPDAQHAMQKYLDTLKVQLTKLTEKSKK